MKKARALLALLVIAEFLSCNQSLLAQEKPVAGKQFYCELFGPGVVMSINFDSRVKSNERLGLGYRIGVGYGFEEIEDRFIDFFKEFDNTYYPMTFFVDIHKGVTRAFYSVPVGLNYVFGNPGKASTFEFGAVVTFLTRKVSIYNWEIKKQGNVIGSINFMYRLTPVNSGVSFRIGITPIIGTAGDLYPMFAMGLGYAF